MGENHFASLPVALYGAVLLMAALAYYLLQQRIIVSQGPESVLRKAVGSDWKGRVSPLAYLVAVPLAFWWPAGAMALYVAVALTWLVPDRRIERVIATEH
jgi:uncharacterized membrane protein